MAATCFAPSLTLAQPVGRARVARRQAPITAVARPTGSPKRDVRSNAASGSAPVHSPPMHLNYTKQYDSYDIRRDMLTHRCARGKHGPHASSLAGVLAMPVS